MSAVQCFEGRPKFACAQCSTTVVRRLLRRILFSYFALRLQSLSDELISKAFSGREGRGTYAFSILYTFFVLNIRSPAL